MRKYLALIASSCLMLHLVTVSTSCKHEPLLDEVTNPVDTTAQGVPCDPDKVYFELEVLPILLSNCAFSGCHDAASAEDGVILDSYDQVIKTGKVKPFKPNDSKLYKVLVDNDADDRMPLDRPPLPQDQIALISKWIQQGATNLKCDPDAGACDSTNVTYTQSILPVINTYCKGCHSGTAPSGNIDLATYQGVKVVATNGKLLGSISWSSGFSKMPQGGNRLPDCTIAKFKTWIDGGAPEN